MKGYNLDTGENLLFYDVEVFKEDSLVVFMDFDKENKTVFHNDFTELKEFIEGKTLVGFNNYFYDDAILHYMLDGKTPYHIKQLNDRIISGERVKIRNYEFDSLDAWQQIDVSMPSLKKIEGNMGKMILESSVSFDIDRKLTDEELKETIDYCTYDVEMTVEVFKKRIDSYFKPKEKLINMYGDSKGARWNTTTLSANVLMNKPNPKWAYPRIPEDMANMIDEEILDLWMNKDKGKITIDRYDSSIEFGFGGLHGVHKHISKAENVKLLDVALKTLA